MYYADHNTGRVSISRVELTETFDDGDFQLVHALGHADESFHRIGRNLPFGFGSHAPAGSVGHVLSVGGRRDAAWALGLEHPDHRRKNLAAGESVLYNAHGDVIFVHKKKIKVTTETFEVKAQSIVLDGPMQLKGQITHTGNMTTSGTHTDANGVHA